MKGQTTHVKLHTITNPDSYRVRQWSMTTLTARTIALILSGIPLTRDDLTLGTVRYSE